MSEMRTFGATTQILAFVDPQVSVSVIVAAGDVQADSHGRKIIPAGTPVGGADNVLEEDGAKQVAVATDATARGVLLHDVDVTSGQGNGTMLIFGFVNLNRIPNVTIPDAVKTALDGKVTFLARN